MTTFWVSKARFYCEYCKCWLADNKPSIDFHNQGDRHKEAVRIRLREARKKTVEESRQKRETDEIMRQINADAMKAMKQDIAQNPHIALRDSSFQQRASWQGKPGSGTSASTAASVLDRISQTTASRAMKIRDERASYPAPPVMEWTECRSPEGHIYYYNTKTGESSWTMPAAAAGQTHETQENQAGNEDSSEAAASMELWAEVSTEDGKQYYLNTATGETSWSKPEVESEANKDKGSGKKKKHKKKDKEIDWAYTEEESRAISTAAVTEEETEARRIEEEAQLKASNEPRDRTVPKHLLAQAEATKVPAFKAKKPIKEGIVGAWAIVTKSSEEGLMKSNDTIDSEPKEAEIAPSKSVSHSEVNKKDDDDELKSIAVDTYEPAIKFETKAMPDLKRRKEDDGEPIMIKKKKKRGNQNFKKREKQY